MRFSILIAFAFFSCTKKVGTNPELAYSDRSLLDSAKRTDYFYYKNTDTLRSAAGNSPHGNFKLRFNSTAFKALTAAGKLPVNGKFPNGSMIIKDVYKGGTLSIYALMYKRNNNWLWVEGETNGTILYTQANPGVCINCHNQAGNRDFSLSFNYH